MKGFVLRQDPIEQEMGSCFMRRALELAAMGGGRVSPNPFVGAVITAGGRIIGEGYHRSYGEAHAEVNAVASVREADRPLLHDSTMYVTLEPCSHFGKTPPCADLIIKTGIPRVVVATEDPFLKDRESGIGRMRNAGVEVEVGLMERESRWLNRRFFTAHTLKRPFVLLKWAMSADGYLAGRGGTPVKLSTPFTQVLMHKERSLYDAIMVGTNTVLIDNPRLDCRLWPTRNPAERPLKITFDSARLKGDSLLEKGNLIKMRRDETHAEFLCRLYRDFKIISLMVEGGRKTLDSFIEAGLYDEIRVETAEINLGAGVEAPCPAAAVRGRELEAVKTFESDGNIITTYSREVKI